MWGVQFRPNSYDFLSLCCMVDEDMDQEKYANPLNDGGNSQVLTQS